MIGRSARLAAKYVHRGSRVGEATNPGPPKSLLRRRGPFALPVIRNVVPRVEQSQVLAEEAEPELLSQRHRVVPSVPSTVQDPVRPTEVDMESGSRASETDTESLFSSAPRSEALPEVEVDSESQFVSVPALAVRPSARTQSRFIALDTVNVREIIAVRACVMKAPPAFLGAYKSAMRLALKEIVSGMEMQNQLRISRGWKLFVLLPRILLFRPARGGKVPKNHLLDRLQKFANGSGLISWD